MSENNAKQVAAEHTDNKSEIVRRPTNKELWQHPELIGDSKLKKRSGNPTIYTVSNGNKSKNEPK